MVYLLLRPSTTASSSKEHKPLWKSRFVHPGVPHLRNMSRALGAWPGRRLGGLGRSVGVDGSAPPYITLKPTPQFASSHE